MKKKKFFMVTESAESQLKMKYSRVKRLKNAGKTEEINESYLINKFTGNEWKRTNEVGEQFLFAQKTHRHTKSFREPIYQCMHASYRRCRTKTEKLMISIMATDFAPLTILSHILNTHHAKRKPISLYITETKALKMLQPNYQKEPGNKKKCFPRIRNMVANILWNFLILGWLFEP